MNKTPKLRFKEFSGDWNENALGDIIEISKTKYNRKSKRFYREFKTRRKFYNFRL